MSEIYALLYPKRRHTQPEVFENLQDRVERTENVLYGKHEREKSVTSDDNQMTVVLSVFENPPRSAWQLGKELPFSATSISRRLRNEHFYFYHIQLLQELQPQVMKG